MTEQTQTLGRPSRRRTRLVLGLGLVGATALVGLGGLWAATGIPTTWYYSTAAPPQDCSGPVPLRTVLPSQAESHPQASARLASARPEPSATSLPPSAQTQIAAASAAASVALPISRTRPEPDTIAEAKKMIAECKRQYQALSDYTCTFFKRERLSDGRMTRQNVMLMKARTEPASVYFKFLKPNAGREAIFVSGQNGGKALVHDVGIGKLLAGTLKLDPRSSMAMDGCRHPITEAGLGHMIDEITERWAIELKPGECEVTIHHNAQVGTRTCTMIESKHPEYHPDYLFHMVKVYIDQEQNLPIRFEAYDWPRQHGAEPELVEEYTYMNLKTDVGFSDQDFDPNNSAYSFGRF
ncbi:MAG TPA: DUF1571 domain-containing protein [Isosphaeraceae bacterium]|nr:DUF1571 domain-containing protein [Isosphaeraceae bacterium]